MIKTYLASVLVHLAENITKALWGTKVSPATISNFNKKAYEHTETWRTRPLAGDYSYVYVDGVYLKCCWDGEIRNAITSATKRIFTRTSSLLHRGKNENRSHNTESDPCLRK